VLLRASATTTDNDGDVSAAGSDTVDLGGNIKFADDGPAPFYPEHAYVVNDGVSGTSDIDEPFQIRFNQPGADQPGSVVFSPSLDDATLLDTLGNPITSDSKNITLQLSGDGKVLTGYTDFGLAGQALVLTVTINNDGTYSIDLDKPLDDGTTLTRFNPSNFVATPGNTLFNLISDVPVDIDGDGITDNVDVLFTGVSGFGSTNKFETTNISTTGTGVQNQSVGQSETLLLDFADEFALITDPNAGHFTVKDQLNLTGGAIGITQTNPNGEPSVAKVQAYSVDLESYFNGVPPLPDTTNSNSDGDFDSPDATDKTRFFTEMLRTLSGVIINDQGFAWEAVADGLGDGAIANGETVDGITVYFADTDGIVGVDTAYFSGILTGDFVGVTTTEFFDRLAISSGIGDTIPVVGGGTFGPSNSTFDVGDVAFQIEGQAGSPIDLSVDVLGIDADGDSVSGEINITVMPDDANNIVGTELNDSKTGTTGNDLIAGLAGDDTLDGGSGNDILVGGIGADSLTGGDGEDTFVFETGDTGITLATADTIIGFTTADDVIDTSLAAGNVTIADSSGLTDFAAFLTAADASLAVGVGTNDAYLAYDAAGSGNGWLVIDENDSGLVDVGDTLIVLVGVNTAGEFVTGDIA